MFLRKAAPKALLLLALAAGLAGCFGGSGGGTSPTLYIAGYRYGGTKIIPCLWTVTGTGSALTDLTHNFSGTKSGYTTSVFAAAGGTYIGGYYYDANDNAIPCYWQIAGGVQSLTAFGPAKSYVESVFVCGNAVYTAGYDWSGPNYLPCCWRGDTEQMKLSLPTGAAYGEALSVFGADENTSYAAGWYDEGGKDRPCYWISYWSTSANDRMALPALGDYGGKAASLAVAGNTVYTAGWYKTATGTGIPCYWVNQDNPTVLSLPTGAAYGYAKAIAVASGTVYTAGYCSDGTNVIPCYWTGASPTTLPFPAGVTKGWAEAMAVSSGLVYTAGYYTDANGNDIPCYWRGTARAELPIGGAAWGRAASVFVR